MSELSVHARRFLRNRLQHQPSEFEDLLQETFLAVYSRRETYLPDQPATAWVFAIARYKLARGGCVMMRFTTR
ncbi:sigma factor [Pseudomonas sp. BF-B-27]|uniref:sigma factor n=1 Tax=Pseudomonas sp. BF-B-27 TaxID=2832354 RepID=UPI001CBB705E|nr:sigma factor [Pseudomonas sp. BF-B-27]